MEKYDLVKGKIPVLLLAIVCCIAVLVVFEIPFEAYNAGGIAIGVSGIITVVLAMFLV